MVIAPPLDVLLCSALLQLFCLLQTGAFIDLISSNSGRGNKKNNQPVSTYNDVERYIHGGIKCKYNDV